MIYAETYPEILTLDRFLSAEPIIAQSFPVHMSYEPQIVPDHFVIGPMFVAVTADVDCDGTGYAAHGIAAPNLAAAKDEADRICASYSGWSVMTVPEFRAEYGDDKLHDLFDEPLWVNDGVSVFYASLGADEIPTY